MNFVTSPRNVEVSAAQIQPRTEASISILRAARAILTHLETGAAIDRPKLSEAMRLAFGGTDADGRWVWKDAYDACEVAQVMFVRKFGVSMAQRVIRRGVWTPIGTINL